LDRLHAAGRKVEKITALDIGGHAIGRMWFEQIKQNLAFKAEPAPFAYRIDFE
jgi:hypothetical protein